LIFAQENGEVKKADANEVIVKYSKAGNVKYIPQHFVRSNDGTSINQKVVVERGQKLKKGDPIIEGMSIQGGELSLGRDLVVAFMPVAGLQLRRRDYRFTKIS